MEKPKGEEFISPIAFTFLFARILLKISFLQFIKDKGKAHIKAREISFFTLKGLDKLGLSIHINGIELIKNPSLVLMNHATFGMENYFPYAYMPLGSRIFMDEWLLKLPVIGKGFAAIDPIVASGERPNSFNNRLDKRTLVLELSRRAKEVSNTLHKERPVLIFPEGIRNQDPRVIREFAPPLRVFLSHLKGESLLKDVPVVIGTHNLGEFIGFKPEKILKEKVKKGKANLVFKRVGVLGGFTENPKESLKTLRFLMQKQLDELLY